LSINSIRQGETFGFETGLSGTDTEAFTNTLNVMQYPGDTPAITRTITDEIDTLTSAETAALAVGQWFIYIKSSDSDEDIREPVKLYIAKGWT
jgi:hypothetical protein